MPADAGGDVEFWVVRHGETEDNKKRIIAGHNAGRLSALGVSQAQALGVRLRDTGFDAVFCSDLVRTRQTAEEILRTLPAGLPVFFDARLREKGGGSIEGRPLGTAEKMAKAAKVNAREFRPAGGESWRDVAARSESFVREVVASSAAIAAKTYAPSELEAGRGRGRVKAGQSRDEESGCFPRKLPAVQAPEPAAVSAAPSHADQQKPGTALKVLVVSHGGWIKEMINSHVPGAGALNNSKNCGLYILSTGTRTGNSNEAVGDVEDAEKRKPRDSHNSILMHVHLYNDGSHVEGLQDRVLRSGRGASAVLDTS